MSDETAQRPGSITLLAIVLLLFGIFAFVGSLFVWGEGLFFAVPPWIDLAFPITDLLVNAPASIIAATGLWTMRRYGYLASYFVAGFYIYASVHIFVGVFQAGSPYALEILVPQVLAVIVAVALLVFPNRYRDQFR